jgi:hypothetical protein
MLSHFLALSDSLKWLYTTVAGRLEAYGTANDIRRVNRQKTMLVEEKVPCFSAKINRN